MHGRMAVIAERDILEFDLLRHSSPRCQPDDRPEAGADRHGRQKPGSNGHAQDRPGRGLRRVRRRQSMTVRMPVVVAMSVMVMIGWNHPAMLYYNITPAKSLKPPRDSIC
jgi:hypothetical protein